jgi:hypothetical protein
VTWQKKVVGSSPTVDGQVEAVKRQLHRKVEVDLRKGTCGLKRARGGCESGIETLGPPHFVEDKYFSLSP